MRFLKKIYGVFGLIFLSFLMVILWFRHGLLFAGAEEQLSFYNYSKSLDLFSHIWYSAGTGFPAIPYLSRMPYFLILVPFYKIGIPNFLLEAVTFAILIAIGIVSVYYLIKITISSDLGEKWQRLPPFLAALFYLLNPFSMTQIWGRALSYQFFAFALVPSFLLFFVLSLKSRKITFCLISAFLSLLLSSAYLSPAVVVTSWVAVIIYLAFFLYQHRNNRYKVLFSLFSFIMLSLFWISVNFFWVYPTLLHSKEILTENLTANDNILSLRGLSPNSVIQNVIRLVNREYYDGTYPIFSSSLFSFISWLLPLFIIFAIPVIKKSKYFMFFILLSLASLFITIGANFPTGWLLIWLFKTFPTLQVLRNPYEKFGINLVIAFSPFFAFGLIQFSDRLAKFFRTPKLKSFFIPIFISAYFILLVWPYWEGSFAGGSKTNFWVSVPEYYKQANNWLNTQPGDFRILHLPMLPEEGITYTWPHFYEGVEASEFVFDKASVARNTKVNSGYYSALLEKFGAKVLKGSPYWSDDSVDFKDKSLISELTKLNIRYIIVHFDTDFKKRRAQDPREIEGYLNSLTDIKKVKIFDKLDIYQVGLPENIRIVYSPDSFISYRKVNPTEYIADIKGATTQVNLNFLEQYHPGWEAYIGSIKVENHKRIFSYANNWLIDKTGDYQVNIKYKPQESFYLGYKVTLASVIIYSFILIINFLKTRNKIF